MCDILKATALQRENIFFFRKLVSQTLTSSNSKGSYAIALKFSGEQINLIRKKSMSTISTIMNINANFMIFANASHSLFLKKH